MKEVASKIKSLAMDIAIILALVIGVIAVAMHGIDTKLPSLF